ncbi:type II/IV secretion system ATPase subunit [Natronomonas sp. LN261]|uniref:type II/IV secretion system ATPase subunit n=1 Tax=Natronomonas sp. LN261 TaxID=2750669 RepID=UPI0015EEFC11|nr:type II/IV secretion system ATPase subunit [Natronomonas sp. LN261]
MVDDVQTVPAPVPPDSPRAWYTAGVHDQYEVVPGVVATVSDGESGFVYEVREPSLAADTAADLRAVREHFEDARSSRPRTREGAAERFNAGFDEKYERVIDRIVSRPPAARRRLEYYALAELRCLGELTPHALDDTIEVADATGRELSVHLTDYAPAATGIEAPEFVERFSAERIERYTVGFLGYDVPIVRYRERLLGADPFERKYAVIEPDRLPGDDRLIAECKERIWRAGLGGLEGDMAFEDRAAAVRERSESLLSRQLTAKNTRVWVDALRHRVRALLADRGLALPSVGRRFADGRLDDLVYYVLRDLVGHGQLTVPIRDPNLEDIEANRVGERIKVVPRGNGREPTNLVFDSEESFVNVVTKLAAGDGIELSASRPSATVTLDPEGVEQTIRCAVALPAISQGGPHVSIRKQAPNALTPVDLVESGSVPTELVTLLWMLYEHRGVVLFSGSAGAGKTTLMNAHMPFIEYDARPISINEGSSEVSFPHETGVSLTTQTHPDEVKSVSIPDLMGEASYLNPDVEVLAEIDSAESFRTLGEVLQTGHGVLGTTDAESVETLVNRAIGKGLPSYLLSKIDLVVFPKHVDGDRHVESVVEVLSEREAERFEGSTRTVETEAGTVRYNHVLNRTPEGAWEFAYGHPKLGDPTVRRGLRTFERLAEGTTRGHDDVEAEFHRKHGYVEYLVRNGISDVQALFGFLSDLRTNEAATVERIRRRRVGSDG